MPVGLPLGSHAPGKRPFVWRRLVNAGLSRDFDMSNQGWPRRQHCFLCIGDLGESDELLRAVKPLSQALEKVSTLSTCGRVLGILGLKAC